MLREPSLRLLLCKERSQLWDSNCTTSQVENEKVAPIKTKDKSQIPSRSEKHHLVSFFHTKSPTHPYPDPRFLNMVKRSCIDARLKINYCPWDEQRACARLAGKQSPKYVGDDHIVSVPFLLQAQRLKIRTIMALKNYLIISQHAQISFHLEAVPRIKLL